MSTSVLAINSLFHSALACCWRERTCSDWVMVQVAIKTVNKQKLFAKKYSAASKQITSYREMEAGFNP